MRKMLILSAVVFCGFAALAAAESKFPIASENTGGSVSGIELNVSPSTRAHIVWPRGFGFCVDMTAINHAFPNLVGVIPGYWAECGLKKLSPHYRAGYPQSDDHAAFCQSLYLLRERYPDRFDGLDLNQWPFNPCLAFLMKNDAKLR